MGSSDSGMFSGGRSNFSQTCNLLSQYLKEKGSFGIEGLSLDLTPNLSQPKGTMNLLPMIEKSGQSAAAGNLNLNILPQLVSGGGGEALNRFEAETGQMTIFYSGQVIVFDDFSADKAKEIMTLATNSDAARNHGSAASATPFKAQSPAESTTSTPNIASAFSKPALDSDLPIARKNSLARFLEKRKHRITANAPYQTSKHAPPLPKPVKTEEWLGLGSQFPVQVQRH